MPSHAHLAGLISTLPEAVLGHSHLAAWRERRAHLTAAARNLRAIAERDATLADLAEAGVDALVIKGGHLLDTLYPDPALRYISDLDLVVRRESLQAAGAVLEARGFRPAAFELRIELGLEHHVRFLRDDGQLVELHWALWHELGIDGDTASLFARSTRDAEGRRWPSLTDELMIALLHAATHAFDLGPAWLVDVLLLLEHPAVDLQAARTEAARRGGRTAFDVALTVASQLWQEHLFDREGARVWPAVSSPRVRLTAALISAGLKGELSRLHAGSTAHRAAGWALKAAMFDRPLPLLHTLLQKARAVLHEGASGPVAS
jgi:hypothetical protein